MARTVAAALVASALAGAQAARVADRGDAARPQHRPTPLTKMIGNVPIHNYDRAYASVDTLAADTVEDWNILLKDGTSQAEIDSICQALECSQKGHASGVAFVELHGSEMDLLELVQREGNKMSAIEPDIPVEAYDDMEESTDRAIWNLERVGISTRKGDGSGAHVYILDTGVRTTHSEFETRATSAFDATTRSECRGSTSCAADTNGHGTHCAGTATGKTYGVAPGAQVYGVKVLGARGGSAAMIAGGIDFTLGARTAATVISMSLGGSGSSTVITFAVDRAVNSGVTVVVAGGNSNDNACRYTPAGVASAFTIGSTDSNDRRSGFSNYGRCVDFWAPGSSILSAGHRSNTGVSTLSGTSMACPHVAGGAALLLGKANGLSPAQVKSALLSNGLSDKISDLRNTDTNKFLFVG